MKLSKIIKYLIYSDLVFYTGWGLITPIFAIFLLDSIQASAFIIGIAAAIQLIIRSLLRIPFGISVDKGSQKRAYNFMFWGLFISALVPLGFILVKSAWHIYILEAILGASLALSTSGWAGIFARHMDKGKESTEWGVDAVAVGLGPGIAGAVGGLAVTYLGFNIVFVIVAVVGLIGVFLLKVVRKNIISTHGVRGKYVARENVRLRHRSH